MSILELQTVRYRHDRQVIVDEVSFTLQKGSIGCLLGPSGSGKTTILRLIAGFEDVTHGKIFIHQKEVSRPGWRVDPARRPVGIVFQDLALFPHLTVWKNIHFGLHHLSKEEASRRVKKWLNITGLNNLHRRFPDELSGGEQQRVALARAMAPEPDLLLLDEPFSGLDVELRARFNSKVRSILKENHMTALIVTHDQHEAFDFADEIGLLDRGQLQQWGEDVDLYYRPANRFVADFIGQGVFIDGRVVRKNIIQTELGELSLDRPPGDSVGEEVCVLLRPEEVLHDEKSPIKAKITGKAFRGGTILYSLTVSSGQVVLAQIPSHPHFTIGESIGIRLDTRNVVCFKT